MALAIHPRAVAPASYVYGGNSVSTPSNLFKILEAVLKILGSMIRVRFAPSPTGFLHIGSLRTALYNFLFAKHHGGAFILRIEDTDQARLVPGAIESIVETLSWAGITWDEGPCLQTANGRRQIVERGGHGPYLQSERLGFYKKYVIELVAKGSAYRCFCSEERLAEMRKQQMAAKLPPRYDRRCRTLTAREVAAELERKTPSVIRLAVPRQGETVVNDLIHGEVRFQNALIDDQVLMKSDGFPTYHLAVVVDDHLMDISHVIRGEEWLPSTPKHILLYQAFGWDIPQFAHLPLLLNADRSKLSKRTGDVAVESYRENGYLPEALVNFIALLGWNPRADQEKYTLNELVKSFEIEKVNRGGAVVNFEKLKWLNGAYIREMGSDRLALAALPWLKKVGYIEGEGSEKLFALRLGREISWSYLEAVVRVIRQRLEVLSDIDSLASFFFVSELEYLPELLIWKKSTLETTRERLTQLKQFLSLRNGNEWTPKFLEEKIKSWIGEEHLDTGEVLWPLRVALTGREASPGPFEVAAALGRERSLERIEGAIKKL